MVRSKSQTFDRPLGNNKHGFDQMTCKIRIKLVNYIVMSVSFYPHLIEDNRFNDIVKSSNREIF